METLFTTLPVQAGDSADYPREWGRTQHVEQQFGIKRGTLYNLYDLGKVDGKVKRIRGSLTGIRLWNMDSIRRYIESDEDDINEKAPAHGEPGQCSDAVTSLTE